MHDSLRMDVNNTEPESQNSLKSSMSGDAVPHPWMQLQTITPFVQMKPSSGKQDSQDEPQCSSHISQTSGNSKSSCSNSDDSLDAIQTQVDESSLASQGQKKLKQYSERHSDPGSCINASRRGSHSSFTDYGSSRSSVHGGDQSLKRKFTSSEDFSLKEKQCSVSSDGRVPHIKSSYNENKYSVAENGSKALRPVTNRLSSSLLIESLIDQLCKMMAPETKQQQALYKIICNKLYEMHLIDRTYAVDELQIVRNHYQKALYQMLTVAKSATQAPHQRNVLLPLPRVKLELPLGQSVIEVSRYKDEFEELKFLAKGGFGKVYRVRHRLDGACYAVKKIYFRNSEHILQSVQEVKMLANLNHPNVVSYKAAWIEPVECSEYESISSTSTRSTGSISDSNNSSNVKVQHRPCHDGDGADSDDIIFADPSEDARRDGGGDCIKEKPKKQQLSVECVQEKVTKVTTTTVAIGSGAKFKRSHRESTSRSIVSTSASNAVLPYRSTTVSKEYRSQWVGLAILYVQMQLCELTLRQWLDERNNSASTNMIDIIPVSLNLFRQIVQGVEYIHAQKIVHHDIKPSNIFLSSDLSVVQVGDFGLSCWFRPQLKHGCNVGTPQYAAPEQVKGECDPKSDIFSLGIILVEILLPFQTGMERAEIMSNLRKGKLPQQLQTTAPSIANLVNRLIQPQSKLRPTATELLKELHELEPIICAGQCVDEKSKLIHEISAKYEAVIESKDREISELKRRLMELERSITKDESND